MIETLAASMGLAPGDPAFWMPLSFMLLLFLVIAAGTVFDGFDIGVGILVQWAPAQDRGRMMGLLSPWRDANEFWLLLGLGLFAAAFPFAWGVVLGALYAPLTLMVIGAVLRTVSFEFRIRAADINKPRWVLGFCLGSIMTALGQGMALGRIATGFQTVEGYGWFSVSSDSARWPPMCCWAPPGWSCGYAGTCSGGQPCGRAMRCAGLQPA